FLPVTKVVPKELIPIINVPMIQYVVEEVISAGIKELIFVSSEGKEAITNYFKPNKQLENFLKQKNSWEQHEHYFSLLEKIEVTTILQKEQLGLGHAVLCAEKQLAGETFAVLLGDEIMLGTPAVTKQLMEIAIARQASVIGVMEIPLEDTLKYGVIVGKQDEKDSKLFKMSGMVEKPKPELAPSRLATPGRYIFTSDIFTYLKKIKIGALGEYQLTDAIDLMSQEKNVMAYAFTGERFDTGNVTSYLSAVLEFALRDPKYRKEMISLIQKKLEFYA
ncbi:MAG: UTP--glucose-1-phosphate uridylyltransferase, partial [Bacteriovoracaceae bacterium]|nr:UTP--glucose-1-phosphate uridylyltransferase [Bacteriovoracaceae bacterium]